MKLAIVGALLAAVGFALKDIYQRIWPPPSPTQHLDRSWIASALHHNLRSAMMDYQKIDLNNLYHGSVMTHLRKFYETSDRLDVEPGALEDIKPKLFQEVQRLRQAITKCPEILKAVGKPPSETGKDCVLSLRSDVQGTFEAFEMRK